MFLLSIIKRGGGPSRERTADHPRHHIVLVRLD